MLSSEAFVAAYPDGPIDIPQEIFEPPPDREGLAPDDPDLRRAVDWLRGYMTPGDWRRRRDHAFRRLIEVALGLPPRERRGRFFDDADTFGWYLFQAESFLDHPWNHEPMTGSRIVPVLGALGRNLDLLRSVEGLDARVARLVGPERRQPNGGLFELLVAAAYRREGGRVTFVPESRVRKSHDMDVDLAGRKLAVECKRMEVGDYGDRERTRMRELWGPASDLFAAAGCDVSGDVDFKIPLSGVPSDYLLGKAELRLRGGLPSLAWDDAVSRGSLDALDLGPLTEVLWENDVLAAGTLLLRLLTGRYERHANHLQAIRFEAGMSPRHVGRCHGAIVLRWRSSSIAAIDAKARDVTTKLSEANRQLPPDTPGVVHVGFEAVEGDVVERVRFEKIKATMDAFDPGGTPMEFVYCHYLVPESPPEGGWAFEETVQHSRLRGRARRPLEDGFLVLPPGFVGRDGPHWRA